MEKIPNAVYTKELGEEAVNQGIQLSQIFKEKGLQQATQEKNGKRL